MVKKWQRHLTFLHCCTSLNNLQTGSNMLWHCSEIPPRALAPTHTHRKNVIQDIFCKNIKVHDTQLNDSHLKFQRKTMVSECCGLSVWWFFFRLWCVSLDLAVLSAWQSGAIALRTAEETKFSIGSKSIQQGPI